MLKTKNKNRALINIEKVSKIFEVKQKRFGSRTQIKAVNEISLSIFPDEIFGLVGESGCGKSTFGRLICRLLTPTEGEIYYKNQDIFNPENFGSKKFSREIQAIFQDPGGSLNPRKNIQTILSTPLIIHEMVVQSKVNERVRELLQQVELQPNIAHSYPPELSGGQQQRVAITRALSLNPGLLVADEPLSALDVSIQCQLIKLFKKMQQKYKFSILFISHDLSIVRYLSDRVGVMYLGNIMESGSKNEIFDHPLHPYTKALLSSIPIADPQKERNRELVKFAGDVPNPMNMPEGCPFHPRCPVSDEICHKKLPRLEKITEKHRVACHKVRNKQGGE